MQLNLKTERTNVNDYITIIYYASVTLKEPKNINFNNSTTLHIFLKK